MLARARRWPCIYPYWFIIIYFIRLWHWKRRLSWPVGQWKSEGMLGRILKVGKKARKHWKILKKPYLCACDCLENKKKTSLFRSSVECRHKMKMKYSDKGTLVQRQRYPLPSGSLQYWPMNHCVRNTTSRRSVFENVSLLSGMENSIIIILITAPLTLKNLNNRRGFAPGPPRRHPPVLPPPSRPALHASNN